MVLLGIIEAGEGFMSLRKERFNASCHKGKLVPLAAEIPV
jgi:hypothetical protein